MSFAELLGRDDVLRAITQPLTAIAGGTHPGSGAVLILGQRGIGRSACLAAACQKAHDTGFRVLQARGSESEGKLAFAGLHRLLKPITGLLGTLPAVQNDALATALGIRGGSRPDQLLISMATFNLVKQASKRAPILVAIDDLQWLDQPSLEAITFLARRVESRRIAVVATVAANHAGPKFAGAFGECPVTKLSPTESAALVQSASPHLNKQQRDWVLRHADGNPLALVELIKVVQSAPTRATPSPEALLPLTPILQRTFGAGLRELSPTGRDVVLVAALAAEESTQEIVAAAAMLGCRDVMTVHALDQAASLGLLHYDECHVTFSHPLVRSAVAASESASRRQAAHRAIGRSVVVNTSRRTWHLACGATGHDDAIAADLEELALASGRNGDPNAAARAFGRAAQLSSNPYERGRRLLAAAKSCVAAGDEPLARRMHAAAVEAGLTRTDLIRAELLGLGYSNGPAGSERVVRLCAAAEIALASDDNDLALDLAYAAALSRFSEPPDERTALAVDSLLAGLVMDSSDARTVALMGLINPVSNAGAVIDLLAKVDENAVSDPAALLTLGVAARVVGDYGRGVQLLDRAQELCAESSRSGDQARVLALATDMRLDVGLRDRDQDAVAELARLTCADQRDPEPDLLVAGAKQAALLGNASWAIELVARSEHHPTVGRGSSVRARAQIVRGIACIVQRRHEAAVTALSTVFDPASVSYHPTEQFGAIAYLSEAAVRCGRGGDARDILERLQPVAKSCRSPLLRAQLQYAAAVLAEDDHAELLFLEALASDMAAWPWPRARLQLAYGRWLRRHRQVNRAREPLEAACDQFERLDARAWASEAQDELDATRRRSRDDRGAEPFLSSLSAQEMKVVRLAAQGLSNHEIGQSLGVSSRTVGSHLYRIFPKLGIKTRGQITPRMHSEEAAHPAVREPASLKRTGIGRDVSA